MKRLVLLSFVFLLYSIYNYADEWIWTKEAIQQKPYFNYDYINHYFRSTFIKYKSTNNILVMHRNKDNVSMLMSKSYDTGRTWKHFYGDTVKINNPTKLNYFGDFKHLKNSDDVVILVNNGGTLYFMVVKDGEDANTSIIPLLGVGNIVNDDYLSTVCYDFYGLKNCIISSKSGSISKVYFSNDSLNTIKQVFEIDNGNIREVCILSDNSICFLTDNDVVYKTDNVFDYTSYETFEYDDYFKRIFADEFYLTDSEYVYSANDGLTWDTIPYTYSNYSGKFIPISQNEAIVIKYNLSIECQFDSLSRARRVVSIHEPSLPNNITIYPNPTSNYLDVSLAEVCSKITAEVLDLEGKALFKMDFENEKDFQIKFPFSLPDGTYTLSLTTDGKQTATNFIIAK